MKKILANYWPLILVAGTIVFNLILLYPETGIKMDLNDNVFAFTLVERMNEIFQQFLQHPSWSNFMLIFDHWVPQWAMGYPLPHFYQHIPDLVVIIIYHLLTTFSHFLNFSISLLTVFNWLKFFMLAFFPLVVYYSARKFEFSRLAAASSALISTLISTNYLYGTDFNALVFRGSGMYTQLWGIFFLPLALSGVYDSVKNGRGYIKAVIFLALVLAGHLVFGYIAVLSTPLLLLTIILSAPKESLRNTSEVAERTPRRWRFVHWIRRSSLIMYSVYFKRLLLILSSTFILLSYWLIPLILDSNYQNKSLWDDYTKFNSYGWEQILKWLFNGEIFDYGRMPVLTILVAMGFFWALYKFANYLTLPSPNRRGFTLKVRPEGDTKGEVPANPSYLFFPLLFIFWLLLYFGRFTWGSFFDLLPMSEGLHGHRLVNGLHFAGIFLMGLAIEWAYLLLFEHSENYLFFLKNFSLRSKNIFKAITLIFVIILILFPAFKERYDYLSWNNHLISYYNQQYSQELPDFALVLQKINQLGKARINLGRPGNWGRNFTVGGFSAYFVASENGFDTIGFLPESWSAHSDIEQFFSENDPNYYNLFNVHYIIAPPEQKFSSFAQKVGQYGKYVLYKVNTEGLSPETSAQGENFSFINSDILIYTKKTQKMNLDRFWIGSPLMPQKEHPTIIYNNNFNPPCHAELVSASPSSFWLVQNQIPKQVRDDNKCAINYITMTDFSNYKLGKPDAPIVDYNLFRDNPFDRTTNNLITNFSTSTPSGEVLSENSASNYFSANVTTPKDSLLLLRATYHPFWHAFVDGQEVHTFMVEPAMTAIRVPSGKHEVEFKYYAGIYKQILILISLLTIPGLYFFLKHYKNLL